MPKLLVFFLAFFVTSLNCYAQSPTFKIIFNHPQSLAITDATHNYELQLNGGSLTINVAKKFTTESLTPILQFNRIYSGSAIGSFGVGSFERSYSLIDTLLGGVSGEGERMELTVNLPGATCPGLQRTTERVTVSEFTQAGLLEQLFGTDAGIRSLRISFARFCELTNTTPIVEGEVILDPSMSCAEENAQLSTFTQLLSEARIRVDALEARRVELTQENRGLQNQLAVAQARIRQLESEKKAMAANIAQLTARLDSMRSGALKAKTLLAAVPCSNYYCKAAVSRVGKALDDVLRAK